MDHFVRQKVRQHQLELAQNIQALNRQLSEGQGGALAKTFEIVRGYDALAADLYRLRASRDVSEPLRTQVEDFFSDASHQLVGLQAEPKDRRSYARWKRDYQRVWRENLPLFLFTLTLFLASIMIGWHFTVQRPEFAPLLVNQGMMENILEKNAWFESLQESSVFGGVLIAWNNIMVSLKCFLFSALLGLGGLLLLAYNGVNFGAVMGFCYSHGFDAELGSFVISHGILELTLIVAASFTGLLFGRVFYMRPYRLFRQRMKQAAHDGGLVLLGLVPWFLLAAAVESLVSPWPQISVTFKLALGALLALLFWIWTFYPAPHMATEVRRSR